MATFTGSTVTQPTVTSAVQITPTGQTATPFGSIRYVASPPNYLPTGSGFDYPVMNIAGPGGLKWNT